MKTARFSTIVQKCGKPTIHLVLVDPKKDRELQAAVKADKVMTVAQPSAGHQTDRAAVGFEPGPGKQFLVFPKSLHAYEGASVIGIKYDLVKEPAIPEGQLVKNANPAKPRRRKRTPENSLGEKDEIREASTERDTENTSIAAIKKKVRRAMKVLAQGKHVAAFNLLKDIVNA
jgi:hypothetical protein